MSRARFYFFVVTLGFTTRVVGCRGRGPRRAPARRRESLAAVPFGSPARSAPRRAERPVGGAVAFCRRRHVFLPSSWSRVVGHLGPVSPVKERELRPGRQLSSVPSSLGPLRPASELCRDGGQVPLPRRRPSGVSAGLQLDRRASSPWASGAQTSGGEVGACWAQVVWNPAGPCRGRRGGSPGGRGGRWRQWGVVGFRHIPKEEPRRSQRSLQPELLREGRAPHPIPRGPEPPAALLRAWTEGLCSGHAGRGLASGLECRVAESRGAWSCLSAGDMMWGVGRGGED